jgi:flavin reductase (DIM6/NTAB) family NADH-FMN oxidoreductase RutF
VDERTFRNTMGTFATGVTVLTTCYENKVHGMTANAFMSVSLNPKLISVSVDEKAQMHNKIREAGKFAVSILSDQQEEVSKHFAGQIKENRKTEFEWFHDIPIIKHSLANIVCKVYNSHKEGDHTLYIGKVIDILLNEGNPLTFYQGQYGRIDG